jgi:hypothetical protein
MLASAVNARTRTFARVIGPYVTIVTLIVIGRANDLRSGPLLSAVFDNPAIVWILGALLLLGGLIIIANHQYWSTVAAALVSLFGWFLAVRGVMLLAVPDVLARGASTAVANPLAIQAGFGLLAVVGLYLTFVGWIRITP